jgi:ubiquitin C-terminal hydrolase
LKCSLCKWVSPLAGNDVFLKLYIPPEKKGNVSLDDLVVYNSNVQLATQDAVWCGNCNAKTPHTQTREYNPNLFLIEIVRVIKTRHRWVKNPIPISFSTDNLILSGFSRKYKVIASCHHKGTLKSGHWFSKILTVNEWFTLDDLKAYVHPTCPPGSKDNSAAVLLLAAEDMLF